ncbi:hypothetical protein C8250_034655 [Streptomyces sp. So13.3]|uniref:hypothetical protein n=1 Tax=Streptomyces TaxID=1883 RepID=UPI00164DF7F1|nr:MULTISPECIES: hypothetical protein [unclassified Streptomyces]MCZ4103865.1 hypothetical protein [Streptomyces sp. H39-C1]QNA76327.1 hypothetical protein C8250_034655 [Streptomyces sp. So13.3]
MTFTLGDHASQPPRLRACQVGFGAILRPAEARKHVHQASDTQWKTQHGDKISWF